MDALGQAIVVATGGMFLLALLAGVWKWRAMLASPQHLAPPYVDIAHRAALMYSFAGLLVWHFAAWSVWPTWLDALACAGLFLFFYAAVLTYLALGWRNETDNQFSERRFATVGGMWLLIAGEIGGFAILFSGTLAGF